MISLITHYSSLIIQHAKLIIHHCSFNIHHSLSFNIQNYEKDIVVGFR